MGIVKLNSKVQSNASVQQGLVDETCTLRRQAAPEV
jgi:hypothetical protein